MVKDNIMATPISRTHRNVTWVNIETKDALNCEIVVNMDDGTSKVFGATVGKPEEGSTNEDWDAIMEKFGEEAIDEATTEEIQAKSLQEQADRLRREENSKRQAEFELQEALFAFKLDAFEIDLIKASTNREMKSLIRKSKSIAEAQAYTTILMMKELDNGTSVAEPITTTTEEQPAE